MTNHTGVRVEIERNRFNGSLDWRGIAHILSDISFSDSNDWTHSSIYWSEVSLCAHRHSTIALCGAEQATEINGNETMVVMRMMIRLLYSFNGQSVVYGPINCVASHVTCTSVRY